MNSLSQEERETIERFAVTSSGTPEYDDLRPKAIAVYEKYCFHGADGDHIRFMSEVTSKCPDYGYRALLRAKLRKMMADDYRGGSGPNGLPI